MTESNIYGPGVSWRDVRTWALAGIRLWLPAYLKDSERHHGLTPGYARLPKTFRAATEPTKWPNEALPALIVSAPGLVTDDPPVKQPDRTYMAAWIVAFTAAVHGRDEDDAELLASVYGLAVRKMVDQQAAGWAELDAYTGPALEVDSVTWEDEMYDDVPQERRRSVVAATASFTVVFRNVSTSMGGPAVPPDNPGEDPGDWPEITSYLLELERESAS